MLRSSNGSSTTLPQLKFEAEPNGNSPLQVRSFLLLLLLLLLLRLLLLLVLMLLLWLLMRLLLSLPLRLLLLLLMYPLPAPPQLAAQQGQLECVCLLLEFHAAIDRQVLTATTFCRSR